MGVEQHLEALRQRIGEVPPNEARALQQRGAQLIDIRESEEIVQGSPEGAAQLTRGYLELRIADIAPDPEQPLLLLCGGGLERGALRVAVALVP